MSECKKSGAYFVGYEYMEISVPEARRSLFLAGYESFGWQQDENYPAGTGKLHLCRDRKILNKMELTRLQRNFEASMEELDVLEASKTKIAQIAALTLDIIGTAFMAGSTFAITAATPMLWLCIQLAVPGFIGWILPYFLYKKLVQKKTAIVTPLIEKKYDEIYELCKKGNALLN